MSFRPNNTLRKKWRHLNAPKLAHSFFLPVSDGLIKAMSSPDRTCFLMPRDVHFALTLFGEHRDCRELCPCIQESHESLPTKESFGGGRPRCPKQERPPCCAKQSLAQSDTLSHLIS